MQPILKSAKHLKGANTVSLPIMIGVFVNACLIAGMFHQDTRWILGKASLKTAAQDAVICVGIFLVVSLVLVFTGSLNFRRKFGWRVYIESSFLLSCSVLLIGAGLLAQSRAFHQYLTGGMFALSGMSFFFWAMLPLAGFFLLCRLLDRGISKTDVSRPMGNTGQ